MTDSQKIDTMLSSMADVKKLIVEAMVDFGLDELEKLNFASILGSRLDFTDVVDNTLFQDIGYDDPDKSIKEKIFDKLYKVLDQNQMSILCLSENMNTRDKTAKDRAVDSFYREIEEKLSDLFDDLLKDATPNSSPSLK